jgi:UDP-N-acetylglucosamine--dolichyl-phosphate N-acetylglucosaminephosphotransferase
MANSFAGLNGWEVGSSAIAIGGLTIIASFSGTYTSTLVLVSLVVLGAALALFAFNKYPAKIFPGDSGTLLFGSFMGCIILFSDYWFVIVGLFIPHIFDMLLKLSTNLEDISQKSEKPYVLNSEGKLEVPKSGKMDFAKFLLKHLGPMEERKLTIWIRAIVLLNTLIWTTVFVLLKINGGVLL